MALMLPDPNGIFVHTSTSWSYPGQLLVEDS
jgi:hypothetical protein